MGIKKKLTSSWEWAGEVLPIRDVLCWSGMVFLFSSNPLWLGCEWPWLERCSASWRYDIWEVSVKSTPHSSLSLSGAPPPSATVGYGVQLVRNRSNFYWPIISFPLLSANCRLREGDWDWASIRMISGKRTADRCRTEEDSVLVRH